MRKELQVTVHPETNPDNIVQGEKYRFSLLTDRLLRLEYSPHGSFEDRATQSVWNRNFPEVSFSLVEKEDLLEIFTDRLHLIYDKKEFTPNGLSVQATGDFSPYGSIWHYGEDFKSLGGTARTLDEADGEIPLENGIIGINGFSVLDDSRSLVLLEDGFVEPRRDDCIDLYFWAYGRDYLNALKDFYHLCGRSSMIPRYALGNWWSRFYEYSADSYRELVERFAAENLPFSVAVIDMDWHLTDIDPKYGSGWTGYSWNRKLFPEPEKFLGWLHEQNMHVTLNVHPADGIHAHEDVYPQMAEAMGVDTEHEQPVIFDAADPKFLEACFQHIFHPMEETGVDFWWIDWQSGGFSKVKGLDPLWVLNHYHYLDNARDGKRPMTFSRYAGPGSHRYPVGFSGDTIITWDSLDFQPYFTAAASNIGYGLWSHDIGGHMMGTKDDELAGRWLQFGVFSPILRLHSSKSEFTGKEPWRYKTEIREMMGRFLRLRHQLIPYLYTMNHRAYEEGIPVILPMYYHYPMNQEAYHVRNQYEFGSELIVAPVTSPRIQGLNVAKIKVWLPEGIYFDFFTGRKYRGGRMIAMYRGIEAIPVLAKAGAIVPMTHEIQDAGSNPGELCIHIFAGACGKFTLYEDDNISQKYQEGQCVLTNMHFTWGGHTRFVIEGAKGNTELLKETRDYIIQIHGVGPCSATASIDGSSTVLKQQYDARTHTLICNAGRVPVVSEVSVDIMDAEIAENNVEQDVFQFLDQTEISFYTKEIIYKTVQKSQDSAMLLSELSAIEADADLISAVTEIVTA
ncbi:MAG: DUF5110 domain-containing protein [Dorea sp.]|nr:DUF5110 domain-containing protein [Dorea sp.]